MTNPQFRPGDLYDKTDSSGAEEDPETEDADLYDDPAAFVEAYEEASDEEQVDMLMEAKFRDEVHPEIRDYLQDEFD